MSDLSSPSFPRPPLHGLPPHLLRSPDEGSNTDWTRTPSPINRGYFRRRVRFRPEEEEEDRHDGAAQEEEEDFFPWVILNRKDRAELSRLSSALRDPDPLSVSSALDSFPSSALPLFPPEIFLQRPSAVNALLELCAFSPNRGDRQKAADAIRMLCESLGRRMDRLADSPEAHNSQVVLVYCMSY